MLAIYGSIIFLLICDRMKKILKLSPRTHRPSMGEERINVLHIIQGKHFGGAEQVVLTLAKSVDRCVISPFVCCLYKGLFFKKLIEAGIPCFVIQMNTRLDLMIPLYKLIKLMQTLNIDIIHTHSVRSNMLGRIAALLLKAKCVTHLHSPIARDFADMKRGKINEIIDSITRPITSKTIAVSKSLQNEMLEKGMRESKIVTIYNAIDLYSLQNALGYQNPNGDIRKEYNIPQSAFIVVLVALLRPRKGVEILISAAEMVLRRCPNAYFLIVGSDDISEDPQYGSNLRRMVDNLNLSSRFVFTGFRNDIPNILNRCDLMVLPSLFGEGLPMVILEAIACGVPIIATKVEGIPEIIEDGINGFIVEAGVVNELSKQIVKLMQEPQLREKFKKNAYEKIELEMNSELQAQKVLEVYREILAC